MDQKFELGALKLLTGQYYKLTLYEPSVRLMSNDRLASLAAKSTAANVITLSSRATVSRPTERRRDLSMTTNEVNCASQLVSPSLRVVHSSLFERWMKKSSLFGDRSLCAGFQIGFAKARFHGFPAPGAE